MPTTAFSMLFVMIASKDLASCNNSSTVFNFPSQQDLTIISVQDIVVQTSMAALQSWSDPNPANTQPVQCPKPTSHRRARRQAAERAECELQLSVSHAFQSRVK
ncbi:hypothetical protein BLNAU_8588 [Blattamonas nauphoetae]|uniref:Uncharacterized protein n=1 Tax=Blattamonas nauphoetae TaxID=2049346 RepID=A0ABQ9XYI2_9EUKA|nr:hypothetical protein BLNAU_8588 [Blattamonas nauphoetae]